MKQSPKHTYTWDIVSVRDEAPHVRSLILTTNGSKPSFIAGQYLTVYLPDFEPVEGKSYSISSATHEQNVRLTIKKAGIFSSALFEKSTGDTLITSAPYGFFYPDETSMCDIAFVVGGIGIAPCMSIIETLIFKKYPKKISVSYSNQTIDHIVFRKELDSLIHACPHLTVTYYITREQPTDTRMHSGRMTAESILDIHTNQSNTDFFICGSIDFTKSMWKELRGAGIESTRIYTEGFF